MSTAELAKANRSEGSDTDEPAGLLVASQRRLLSAGIPTSVGSPFVYLGEVGSAPGRARSRKGCVTRRMEIVLKACLMRSSTLGSGMSNDTTGMSVSEIPSCSSRSMAKTVAVTGPSMRRSNARVA
jgi:hypothetical protein